VWRVGLAGPPAGVAASDDEVGRAGRLRDERRRARFLASRAWLRVILGRYLGVDAASVRLCVASRGKPSIVDGGDLCFSLSRSAGVALIAVSRGRSIGVDVERVQAGFDHADLAERFFTVAEADLLRELAEPDRTAEFFRLWVRKEAVAKASGAGLGDGLSHLDVRGETVAGRWSVASLDVGADLAVAVAVEGAMGPIHPWQEGAGGEP